MEQINAFPAVAAFSAALLAAAVAAVVLAERCSRWLSVVCVSLLALESALLAVAFGRAAAWMQAIDSLGVLTFVLALALRFATPRPLTRWSEANTADGDPPWWPAFERSFRRYTAAPRRDPLRAACTRRREDGR
jgi:hypothetical protein